MMSGGGTTSVDRRPSKLLISGYDADDKDEVIAHFSKFGEVVDQIEDEAVQSLIFHYKTRREAEQAMVVGGKTFTKAELALSW